MSDLIFAEPIVEAVARIKAVLKNENLIACDYVRPPQQGISEAERAELLKRYAELRASTVSPQLKKANYKVVNRQLDGLIAFDGVDQAVFINI